MRFIHKLLLAVVIILLSFAWTSPVFADNNGDRIFTNNCSSCHLGGGNILIANKTLHKEALSQYLDNYNTESIQAIIHQIKNGKGAMPAFKNKLNEEEILEVAAYVFQKAEQGW
ncbi:cytochrome c6 [Dulcicalothrix desertica PCC 7102]|uniref:Cytochrome c6 n=1 Tax=Dulcicalothrix desertica PCC 7102 TaxID=232991 RepID=A0A3S1CJY5_9CYAN|nr:c-type cytochrome [Dulcicalothrix desertica]RUT08994.1 cytochrome c6 [Dulcicalothrix desertica PCC 7102]TWH49878.1 cytochrome c6 [Dulcicalothrix desertica PCC 7102]